MTWAHIGRKKQVLLGRHLDLSQRGDGNQRLRRIEWQPHPLNVDLVKDIEAAREALQAFLASNRARDELVAARAKVLLVSCDAALQRSRSYDDGASGDDVRAFLACLTAFLAEATR